jgi:hypothetical protein
MSEVRETKSAANDAATKEERGGSRGDAAVSGGARGASHIVPLVLQRDIQAGIKDQYHVEELLQYHDALFIENVYRVLLGREPFDAERARELDELRGGRAGKVEIIERLLSSPEAGASGRRVRVEGLPSPVVRRLSAMPVVGYVLRLARALVRLPVFMQHHQQFEIYVLAQQQRIADHVNQVFGLSAAGNAAGGEASTSIINLAQHSDLIETVAMFSDTLLDLSNSHADLQAQTQTQVEQIEAALADLTQAMTVQQQITETLQRGQQEFLIQEQRVIVETQKVLFAELREELRALSERQESARAELDAEVRRLQTLLDAAGAAGAARENLSGQ